MTDSMKAKVVNISIERGESGAYFATSPELKGLLVSKMTIQDLYRDIPRAIAELYALCGIDVAVTAAEGGSEYEHPWVAVPESANKIHLVHA